MHKQNRRAAFCVKPWGHMSPWLCVITIALLTGCASSPDDGSIYVPVGGERGSEQTGAKPDQPESAPTPGDQSAQQQREEPPRPHYRTESQSISPAAAGLVQRAGEAFETGNVNSGMALLQRAQRISPDASAVYYKMAEGHVRGDDLTRAEQFAMKGISVAGTNPQLQKSGWRLLSDIRRARGNVAGAQDAQERASSL